MHEPGSGAVGVGPEKLGAVGRPDTAMPALPPKGQGCRETPPSTHSNITVAGQKAVGIVPCVLSLRALYPSNSWEHSGPKERRVAL